MGFGESHKVTSKANPRPETLQARQVHPSTIEVEYRWSLRPKAGILGGDWAACLYGRPQDGSSKNRPASPTRGIVN